MFCPVGAASWCKFHADEANGIKIFNDKPGNLLVADKVIPIFQDRGNEE